MEPPIEIEIPGLGIIEVPGNLTEKELEEIAKKLTEQYKSGTLVIDNPPSTSPSSTQPAAATPPTSTQSSFNLETKPDYSFLKSDPSKESDAEFTQRLNTQFNTNNSKPEEAKPENTDKETYAKDYKGVSIVDFLDQSGKPSDIEARRKLAVDKGIVSKPDEYKGTAEQNTKLLNALKGGSTSAAPSTSYTSKYMGTPKPPTPKPTDLLPKTGVKGKEVSTHFVRVGPGSYRPAVQADLTSGQQLFIRNPNPALRVVYPYIKVQNAPVRRANL